jgi:CHRD domain-containing protein
LKKIILPLLLLATLGMLATLPHIANADDQGRTEGAPDHSEFGHQTLAVFHIRLTGDQQFPPVSTNAFGFAEVRLFQNGTSSAIEFRVIVCNITNVTHSHIHVGAIGTNGNIIVHFFDQPSNPVSSPDGCTTLAHGVRGPSNLMPDPAAGINTWDDFVHALTTGNTYVNVHTTAHPAGEIRGQLVHELDENDKTEASDD